MLVRNQRNQILVEHHIPYDHRSDKIPGYEICQGRCTSLELCVLSKNSHGSINRWFDTQCMHLPNNLEHIFNEYTFNNNQIYRIHSIRKQARIDADNWQTSGSSSFIILRKKNTDYISRLHLNILGFILSIIYQQFFFLFQSDS